MSVSRSILDMVRQGYQRMVRRQEDARTREVIEVLRSVSIFQSLSRQALRDLATVVHHRRYRQDEFLYYQHDPGLGLYIVKEGCVRLLVEDETGGLHEVRQVTEGGFFGGLSLLGEFRRLETAQAITETQALGFFSPDLKTLVKRNPAAGAAVSLALARHLAAQQVAMVHRIAEEDGRLGALRLLRGAIGQEP